MIGGQPQKRRNFSFLLRQRGEGGEREREAITTLSKKRRGKKERFARKAVRRKKERKKGKGWKIVTTVDKISMEFREKWNERKFASLDPSPVQRADIARPLRSHPLSSRFLSRHVSLHALGSAPPPVFIYPHLRLPNLSTLCLVSSVPPTILITVPFSFTNRTRRVASPSISPRLSR